jgi:tetratricopeptide (TPR) repeat protein
MQLKPFLLDAWLDTYEHDIEFNLAASTGPVWTVNDILALADDETRHRFLNHKLVYGRPAGADSLRQAIAEMQGVSVDSVQIVTGASEALATLEAAVTRAEAAVETLPDYPNAHYLLALVLGRYSQRISILKALAEGLAGRVRSHLERTLQLEPRHAEAHLAFGLYHAEIVGKLGALAAALTYGAKGDAALEHFRRATRLAPDSPIVLMEHANGLLLLDARRFGDEARALYREAAALAPADAMERLDVERAKRGPG